MRRHRYYVYILTNRRHTVLYIGVTNNLKRRIHEHRTKATPGFTSRYNVYKLVYFERFTDIRIAIRREKQLKNWKRTWKEDLIATLNPDWIELMPR